jgi:hypothetical protein
MVARARQVLHLSPSDSVVFAVQHCRVTVVMFEKKEYSPPLATTAVRWGNFRFQGVPLAAITTCTPVPLGWWPLSWVPQPVPPLAREMLPWRVRGETAGCASAGRRRALRWRTTRALTGRGVLTGIYTSCWIWWVQYVRLVWHMDQLRSCARMRQHQNRACVCARADWGRHRVRQRG